MGVGLTEVDTNWTLKPDSNPAHSYHFRHREWPYSIRFGNTALTSSQLPDRQAAESQPDAFSERVRWVNRAATRHQIGYRFPIAWSRRWSATCGSRHSILFPCAQAQGHETLWYACFRIDSQTESVGETNDSLRPNR